MKEVVYYQKTDSKITEFAHKHCFPGWYIDAAGCYGIMVGKYWISIFVSTLDNNMEIAVDTIGDDGHFDQNIEWETPENEHEMVKTANRFVAKYANKMG